MSELAGSPLFCLFAPDGTGWKCRVCGRQMANSVDRPPVAPCRRRDLSKPLPTHPMTFGQAFPQPFPMPWAKPAPAGGPGTELKKLLASVGINPQEAGCKCQSRAGIMDAWGVDGCEQRIETIVEWLREEATKRRLPFFGLAARMLVRRAIRNARRAAAS